jgi:hypothetical protein
MQKKTIKRNVEKKMEEWLSTISDKELKDELKENILVSGGCIASMFLNEDVNDYDVYIKNIDALKRLVIYYSKPFNLEVLDGREKESLMKKEEYSDNQRRNAILSLSENQIKINVGGGFRVPAIENAKEDLDSKYKPLFFSPNAISLSDDLQVVCRFNGDAEQIHKTFDFIHATNYFTFEEGLVTNIEAIESLLTKQLRYQGSLYPLTSIVRMKKFIGRGWRISAGEMLKSMFQISELDLTDPVVLEDQLIGVDVAYFSVLISILKGKKEKDPNFKPTSEYLNKIIDRVFNDDDESI